MTKVPLQRRDHCAVSPGDLRVACYFLPVFIPAPIQTTSTLYERGFEKIMKRQNKEQVPPPAAESKKPINKKQPKKVTAITSQNQKQGPFRCLEDALKAVSVPRLGVLRGVPDSTEMWKERMYALRMERKWVFVRNIGEKEDEDPKNKMEALEMPVCVLSPTEQWSLVSCLTPDHEQALSSAFSRVLPHTFSGCESGKMV